MGFVYYRKGNTTEAEKYFSKALKNTENPRLFELMGDIFFYLNMQDKAVQNWKLAQSKGMTGQTISDKIINGKI
jgi:predicted negative regulator of RcsB-dependent stress response